MPKQLNLVGQKFTRLLVIEQMPQENYDHNISMWKCKCDCNEITIVKGQYLTSGNTKSCGCLRKEKASARATQRNIDNTLYHPAFTTARKIYMELYDEGDLTFENFFELSQQNCFYCNIPPSNLMKVGASAKRSSEYFRNNAQFIYNGLDRIDNALLHTLNNVVPCCKYCNYAKRDRSLKEFSDWVSDVHANIDKIRSLDFILNPIEKTDPLLLKVLKDAYRNKYNDGNLSMTDFILLSQQNCFYCSCLPSNVGNKRFKCSLKYSGLDRINSDLPHNIDNLVPCCKHCNYAKRERTIEQFMDWIVAVHNHSIR